MSKNFLKKTKKQKKLFHLGSFFFFVFDLKFSANIHGSRGSHSDSALQANCVNLLAANGYPKCRIGF